MPGLLRGGLGMVVGGGSRAGAAHTIGRPGGRGWKHRTRYHIRIYNRYTPPFPQRFSAAVRSDLEEASFLTSFLDGVALFGINACLPRSAFVFLQGQLAKCLSEKWLVRLFGMAPRKAELGAQGKGLGDSTCKTMFHQLQPFFSLPLKELGQELAVQRIFPTSL